MATIEFDYDEFSFRMRDIVCEVQLIEAQIDKLKLEKDKLIYEHGQMDKIYTEQIESQKPVPEPDEVPIEKTKKLKKTDDKLSKNHIEIQQ